MGENDMSQTNSINSRVDSKEGENDRSETTVLEDMCEKGSVDEIKIITDTERRVDENEAIVEHTENKTKSDHSRNTNKYNPSLNLPIALRKGTMSYTKHSISNYVSYESPKKEQDLGSLHTP